MSQLLQVNPKNKDFVKGLILEKTYIKDGKRFIQIHNHRLDFSGEFEFIGFTKAGNKLKLAETNTEFKIQYCTLNLEVFDHVDGQTYYTIKLITKGHEYIERLEAEL